MKGFGGVDRLAASPDVCRVSGGVLPKPDRGDPGDACWAGMAERETVPAVTTCISPKSKELIEGLRSPIPGRVKSRRGGVLGDRREVVGSGGHEAGEMRGSDDIEGLCE